MEFKFNIGKEKDKKVTVEDDDDDELEEVEEKPVSDSLVIKQKMIRFMLFVVGGIIVLLLLLGLLSLLTKRHYTYTDVEGIMKRAAEAYFVEHPESLPTGDNIVEIDSSNLVASGKMREISHYLNDEVCTGTVQVQNFNSTYLYLPYLNCGDNYSAVEFYSKIVKDSQVVSTGYGLYSLNGSYIYRGEEVNNYVKLGKDLWRIVKITPNHNIVLVHSTGLLYAQPWDDRYNETKLYDAGLNQYKASRIRDTLNRIYVNPSEKDEEVILTDSDRAKMVSFTLCIGKRSKTSDSKNNSEECKEMLQSQKIGLLTLSDYLYASIDPNCNSVLSKSCKNYNYLAMKDSWWLLTGSKDDTSDVYMVSRSGNAEPVTAATYAVVRPVITLSSRTLYKSGNGTVDSPYELR